MGRRTTVGPLVAFPDLSVHRSGDRVTLTNPVHGTRIESSPDVLEILRFFRTPATRRDFERTFEVDRAVLDALIRESIVVAVEALPVLRGGLLEAADTPFGLSARLVDLRTRPLRDATHALVGAPFELGVTGEGGTRDGPRALRRAFSVAPDGEGRYSPTMLDVDARASIDTGGLRVVDLGDLQALPGEGLDAIGARLRHVVSAVLDAEMTPVVMGGDHALTHFALDAVAQRFGAVGVLHFDAHLDLRGTASWLTHANVFAFALERPEVKVLRQIGVRAFEPLDAHERSLPDRRLSWVTAREIHGGVSAAQALRGLPRAIPYYLTFDVDVLDPSIAPETGAPVVGGLWLHQVLPIVALATRSLRVVAADFVEVSSSPSRRNGAALSTARLITEFLLAKCPKRPLRPSSLAVRRPVRR